MYESNSINLNYVIYHDTIPPCLENLIYYFKTVYMRVSGINVIGAFLSENESFVLYDLSTDAL